ncbi:MAG TPA: alanine--glyoxylate aminotransferase family protein [Anaerolineales bacterium]|nr:alanine--glyoxylate aminotransferase family protein [Anaerolineales bacterium]HRQ92709.1 alanine--glyoxylate aminotransferase family protein [Anaerolineales bacterium]
MGHLFIPGPVDVDPEIAAEQTRAMLPHRSAQFEEIFRRASENAQKLFFTKYRVFISASSGTGFHEAAVRNFVNQDVLCCVNGAFAERWKQVAESNGKQTDVLAADWKEPITPERVKEALSHKKYEAILVVHNETSTGLVNPVKEIAAVVKQVSPDTLICVDAVSSLGGDKIEMDAWGLDMVLTSAQKALALPPGIALAAVSDRAMAKAEQVANRGWYFDLVRMEKHRLKDSTPATPAIGLVYALDKQLERMLAEGLEARFERHAAMAELTRGWATSRGLELYAPEGYRSQTVTTIDNKLGIDVSKLNAFLSERGMRIANGYGQLKNLTFRIGHMGELTLTDMEELLAAMDDFLQNAA